MKQQRLCEMLLATVCWCVHVCVHVLARLAGWQIFTDCLTAVSGFHKMATKQSVQPHNVHVSICEAFVMVGSVENLKSTQFYLHKNK